MKRLAWLYLALALILGAVTFYRAAEARGAPGCRGHTKTRQGWTGPPGVPDGPPVIVEFACIGPCDVPPGFTTCTCSDVSIGADSFGDQIFICGCLCTGGSGQQFFLTQLGGTPLCDNFATRNPQTQSLTGRGGCMGDCPSGECTPQVIDDWWVGDFNFQNIDCDCPQ